MVLPNETLHSIYLKYKASLIKAVCFFHTRCEIVIEGCTWHFLTTLPRFSIYIRCETHLDHLLVRRQLVIS